MRDSDYYKFAKRRYRLCYKTFIYLKRTDLGSMGYNYCYRADKLSVRREPGKRNIRIRKEHSEKSIH